MPSRRNYVVPVATIDDFLTNVVCLLEVVHDSRQVLFRQGFRNHLGDAIRHLRGLLENADFSQSTPDRESLVDAGLASTDDKNTDFRVSAHLKLKLESFESSIRALDEQGGIDNLTDSLEKARIILGSLAGMIPGVGSVASELVDFVIKEIRRRLPWYLGGR